MLSKDDKKVPMKLEFLSGVRTKSSMDNLTLGQEKNPHQDTVFPPGCKTPAPQWAEYFTTK